MTFLTARIDAAVSPAPIARNAGAAFKARTASLLSALKLRIDRGAEARARRKARRMTAAELSRVPEAVRMDLGVNVPGAGRPSAFVQGLVGPADYWTPRVGPVHSEVRRGDAKS